MKQFFPAFVLLLALSLAVTGCGSAPANPQGPSGSQAVSASVPSSTPSSGQNEEVKPDTSVLASSEVVVNSQSCFLAPYCLRPEIDGTYHFSAITADEFVGSDYDYGHDVISWNIYVLDEEFTDAWRYLSQAHPSAIQDLNGSVNISLKAGQYVYCVPSLNSFTGNPAPDGSGLLTITPVENRFVPGPDNNYQLPITLNSETRYDLDRDGNEEAICYSVQPSTIVGNFWTEAKPSLIINGVSLLDSFLEAGLFLENPEVEYYYIVDLNKGDPYCEIALADWGNNDWLITHYFRYVSGELIYLGSIPNFPSSHSTVFFGDGRVSALTMLNVMQTWRGLLTYQLQGDTIICPEGQFCEPVCEGITVTLERDIIVYEQPDLSSPTLTLTASAAVLSFPSTDGEHWVEIVCADGTSGWAYFANFCTLISGDEELLTYEGVFDGLFLAG